MWPEGVKKREGAARKLKAGPAPGDGSRQKLLDFLKVRQRTEGFLSAASMSEIASDLGLPESEVYGVASFYAFLSTGRLGTHVIRICKSLPCYLKNAPTIIEAVVRTIGITPGHTTPDNRFSFELTNCIGACDEAPAMLIDDTVYGNLNPARVADILKSYREMEGRVS
jgi:NADH:ubiquinone oxidoreductase subunit E